MRRSLGFICCVFLFLPAVARAQVCDCEGSEEERELADLELERANRDHESVDAYHLPFGQPTMPNGASNETPLHAWEYVTNYDADLRTATWVAYRLTAEHAQGNLTRMECFREDPRVEVHEDRALCADYEDPIYDRGHLAPSASMNRSRTAMFNTFVLSNMAPQHDEFNRTLMRWWEEFERDWASRRGEIFVVAGAVFDHDGDGARDPDSSVPRVQPGNRVGIASHSYKVYLYRAPSGDIETLAFLVPHTEESISRADTPEYLEDHIATIDEIEVLTGINFFRALPDPQERAIERFRATRLWPR